MPSYKALLPHVSEYEEEGGVWGGKSEDTSTFVEGLIVIMRGLAATAGGLQVFSGIYSLYPLSSTMHNVPTTMLKLYMVFFGLSVLLVEGKGMLPKHHDLRRWFYSEFGFLNHPRGKGFYYILIGMLSLTLASAHLLFTMSGTALTAFGLLNLVISFLNRRQLRPAGLRMSDFQTTTLVKNKKQKHRKHREAQEAIIPLADPPPMYHVSPVYQAPPPIYNDSGLTPDDPRINGPLQFTTAPRHQQTSQQYAMPQPYPMQDLLSYTDPLRI